MSNVAHTLQVDGRLVELILLAQRTPNLPRFVGCADRDGDRHRVGPKQYILPLAGPAAAEGGGRRQHGRSEAPLLPIGNRHRGGKMGL